MNITRDIVNDLLPTYFSGEASADTIDLIEEYFRQNPSFERDARSDGQAVRVLGQIGTTPVNSGVERAALKRAKRILRWQRIVLALASTFTLNAISLGFSFEIGDGHVRIHWLTLPGQRVLIVAILLLSAALWVLYFRIGRRVRAKILG